MATTFQSSPRLPADANRAPAAAVGREVVPVARARSVLDLIGNTPLLEITRLTEGLLNPGVRIFAKLEGFNPGGSIKDRPAKSMLEVGIAEGKLKPGKVILDSTSGNTGIALAMLGATLGYPVELVMPSNVSRERKKIIEAYGAKIHFSDSMEGSDGAIIMCRQMIEKNPERYFKPDQYNNEANSLAHFQTTGPEIWRQTNGQVTHFVAAIGTGGTIMGAGRFLKSKNRNVKVIALSVDPVESHKKWIEDINDTQKTKVNFPIIADGDRKVSTLYDMIHPNASATATVRSLFIIDQKKVVRLIITYPASTGRNFDEVLRVIDSLQLTEYHSVATPGNWKSGDDVVIVPSLQDPELIKQKFPKGYKMLRPYLRMTPQPNLK